MFSVFVLPFPLLMTLDLGRRQIVALCVTFGLGLITMVVSICRCVALLKNAFIPLCTFAKSPITSTPIAADDGRRRMEHGRNVHRDHGLLASITQTTTEKFETFHGVFQPNNFGSGETLFRAAEEKPFQPWAQEERRQSQWVCASPPPQRRDRERH